MRIVICWHQISGYIAACLRELARQPGIELHVIALKAQRSQNIAFSDDLMRGVECTLLNPQELADAAHVARLVSARQPRIVAICGWFVPAYRALIDVATLRDTRFVMGMDTPRKGTIRQRLGRWRHRRLFGRIDRVIVAGERTWQLARLLGFAESQIRRGFYGFDFNAVAPVFEQRVSRAGGWPRAFVYMGRYVPEKAIDVLLDGYRAYRSLVADPWPLSCCGAGPLAGLMQGQPGVEDRGFIQPADQPAILRDHGVLVLMSRYEPWGVVVAEASGSGMPVICSESCGASVDLVRSCFNGLTVATDDRAALGLAMAWMHGRYDELPTMGWRGRELAAAYSAEMWAARWMRMFAELAD